MKEIKWFINMKRLEIMMYHHSRIANKFSKVGNKRMYMTHLKIASLYGDELIYQCKEGLR